MAESTTPHAVLLERGTDQHATSDDQLIRLAGGFIAGKRSPETRDAYRDDLKSFFRWCRAQGADPLVDVRRTHLELYARHMEGRGLAPSTRQRRIGTVRGWFEWLIDEGLYGNPNPATKVKQPSATPVTDRPALTKRELHVLMVEAEKDSPAAWALVMLGVANGLRVSELTETNIADLGKHGWNHTLRIRGKGEKHDEVAVPPACMAAIEAATDGREVGPILLAPSTGRRMNRRNAATILDRLCRTHELTRITPHGLRRTAITLLLQAGVPIREVQLFARHASPATTAKYDRRSRSFDEHLGYMVLREAA